MFDSRTKDISVVFSKKLTNFKERPAENSRYLIRKNLDSLVQEVCKEILEFGNPVATKVKALAQLKHIIVLAEKDIQKHVAYIIRSLIKLHHKEDNQLDAQIIIISELLGIYTDCGIYFPIIIKALNEEEIKTSPRLLSNLLELSSYLICNETMESIVDESKNIITVLQDTENLYNENVEIMIAGYHLVANFIYVAKELCSNYRSQIFSYLLTLQSIPSVASQMASRIESCMTLLAQNSGCRDLKELYSIEVASVLTGFYDSQSYKQWDKNSKDRMKFDILVRNCGKGLSDFLPLILEISESLIAHQADLETRIDALSLIEFLIKLDEMVEQMRANSFRVMSKILIPATIWKAGKPLIKIRKAGVICMVLLIQRQIISEENLQLCMGDLKPVLKSCLNDDWAPDLRYTTCVLLEHLFNLLRETLTDIDLSDIYPNLLERLDDSQDMIRIEITKAIKGFFQCTNLKMSPGTFEYVVRNLLIHLDDQNEQLQLALFEVLKSAAHVKPKLVLKEARGSVSKQKYPRICQELIRSIEETMEAELRNDVEDDD